MTARQPSPWPIVLGLLGGLVVYGLLAQLALQRDPEALALGTQTHSVFAQVGDRPIHCRDARDIGGCLAALEQTPLVVWLGNSQLHAINHYVKGQPTAPQRLFKALAPDRQVMALSQPNANLQEHLVVLAYVLAQRAPAPSAVVLPLVFDDTRETGLRNTLQDMARDPATLALLASTTLGPSILETLPEAPEDLYAGRLQRRAEAGLDGGLARLWPAWAYRHKVRVEVSIKLYELRNWVFGIRPDTVRRVVPARYQDNMTALADIAALARAKGVVLVPYIVPIRNDVEIPYDLGAYAAFKAEAAAITRQHGFDLANLESLVDGPLWGTIADQIDYMHFQAPGHALLAEAIEALLTERLAE